MIIAVTIPSFLKGNAEGVNLQGEVQGSRGSGGRGNYGQVVFFFEREESSFIRKKILELSLSIRHEFFIDHIWLLLLLLLQ